jgi:DNA ligase-1
MILALAEASGRDETEVRRTVLVTGSIPAAARALHGGGGRGGAEGSGGSREGRQASGGAGTAAPALTLFRPLAPMLAAPSESLEAALARVPHALVEWKIDGIRAQVHKSGDRVAVYSRQGHDITAGCGPVARAALASIAAYEAVLDGEVVLVDKRGVARPFQESFSAVASRAPAREGDSLRVYLFDCLFQDGRDLLSEPLSTRLEALRSIVPEELRMPGIAAPPSASAPPLAQPLALDQARQFYASALSAGNEGVVVKDLSSPYRLGARGRAWQKVKEFDTADLVVLAAEWGSGRRKGWLSNLHLGARREDGSFCMVGKTFKGLTDELLRWQTAELEGLATERGPHVVVVRPELVVEIRFNEVQRSPRYPGRIALRFARVVRYRADKAAHEAEPLAALVARLREPLKVAPAPPAQLSLFVTSPGGNLKG